MVSYRTEIQLVGITLSSAQDNLQLFVTSVSKSLYNFFVSLIENEIVALANKKNQINVVEVRQLLSLVSRYFKNQLMNHDLQIHNQTIAANELNNPKAAQARNGRVIRITNVLSGQEVVKKQVLKLTRKFNDAGRRSPPWTPTSSIVPGRPQSGSDGNRRNRWEFEVGDKYFATEINATLVEIKYYLQTLSMENAPEISSKSIMSAFKWLLGHDIKPGEYLDPIQLKPIDFIKFYLEPSIIQSGHLIPLDRGGTHIPSNTFLMLYRSNQMQGNMTLDELIQLMREIVLRHDTIQTGELNTPQSDAN